MEKKIIHWKRNYPNPNKAIIISTPEEELQAYKRIFEVLNADGHFDKFKHTEHVETMDSLRGYIEELETIQNKLDEDPTCLDFLTDEMREYIDDDLRDLEDCKERLKKQEPLEQAYEKAIEGDEDAMKEVVNFFHGYQYYEVLEVAGIDAIK